MKVKCTTLTYLTNTSPVLFLPYSSSKNEDDFITFSHGSSLNDGVKYHLFVGADYVVYGIMVHDNILYYLISFEETVMPDWIPSNLFEITDSTIPYFWVINTKFHKNDDIMFILSHYEISIDFNHMIGLLQGIPSDFKSFRDAMNQY